MSGDELRNWRGEVARVVDVDGERWVVKSGRRELLGYELGKGHVNVAEVRLASSVDDGPGAEVLVRLADSYTVDDLPLRDLDEAVAGELIYSLWFRRRDTHAFNRAYVDGVPLFFDHGTAFDATQSLDAFLRDGSDNGYVPTWRIEVPDARPTTMGMRQRNQSTRLAVHAIENADRFFELLHVWVDRARRRSASEVRNAVREAGIGRRDARGITTMLRRTQHELPDALSRVMRYLETPMSA